MLLHKKHTDNDKTDIVDYNWQTCYEINNKKQTGSLDKNRACSVGVCPDVRLVDLYPFFAVAIPTGPKRKSRHGFTLQVQTFERPDTGVNHPGWHWTHASVRVL